jgi:cell division protein FtsL
MQQRPDLPLPEKYKYDPNDPYDDKPKMSKLGKIFIIVIIFSAIIFISLLIYNYRYTILFLFRKIKILLLHFIIKMKWQFFMI